MTKYLRIATRNANGLAQRISELQVFLKTKQIGNALCKKVILPKCCKTHPPQRAKCETSIFTKDNIEHQEVATAYFKLHLKSKIQEL